MSGEDDNPRTHSRADLDELQQRIDAKRSKHQEPAGKPPSSAWSLGMRYGSEFFGGVLVGGVLGFGLDLIAGISPFGLIIGTMLGFAAGTLNVVRAAREISSESDGDSA
ncbi:AtpZ/AtpI family protein [Maricaulis sp.]|jgi:ATP synthase protein I|uniref:AtpZ/AtpI family protein n=1 Tax=Maricaulis sp. TaxID=1486257 RepID=UPI0025EFAE4A|nr:AtpZ/AtpI family protein [Maricaulis sp.]MDF1768485.1 AtpZ/AtpI family protein [Maricaulis sp.]